LKNLPLTKFKFYRMRISQLLIISIIALSIVGCQSKSKETSNKTINNFFLVEEIHEDSTELNLFEPNKDFIIETMELYQDLDSVAFFKKFETYKEQVTTRGNYTEQDINWYLENIQHIDSVCNSIKELALKEKYEDIGLILDSELINFYCHPNSDVNSNFQLHWVMVPLYMLIIPEKEEYYDKVIDMWEMNKISMEALQLQTGIQHEYYNRVLHELASFYKEVGNEEKRKEIESILKQKN
ncbi:MAG: hypothetical protein J1F67_10920, partial [Muribaculaceae bacterium]|nr:hypothetical protein [Muribaculaceae bacterium]